MAVSVRMEPLLEKELELAAKRQGITKSQFIVDAVQRALGHRNPYKLMLELQAEEARGVYGPATKTKSGESDVFQGPYEAEKARDFIRRKLAKKHGLRGAR